MPSPENKKIAQTRRPTVRIIKHRRIPRAALVSMAIAAAAAMLVLAARQSWRSDNSEPPIASSHGDVMLVHKCARMHVTRLYGQLDPPICPRAGCNRLTYPQGNFRCSNGHTHEAAIQVARADRGVIRAARLRFPGKEWVSVGEKLFCPTCNAPLYRAPVDPLQQIHRKRGD